MKKLEIDLNKLGIVENHSTAHTAANILNLECNVYNKNYWNDEFAHRKKCIRMWNKEEEFYNIGYDFDPLAINVDFVAHAHFTLYKLPDVCLHHLIVKREYQGLGIGSKTLDLSIKDLQEKYKVQNIIVDCPEKQMPFYLKNCFEEIGDDSPLIENKLYIMMKTGLKKQLGEEGMKYNKVKFMARTFT